MTFDGLLVTGATWALMLGAAWTLLVLAAATVEVVTDGRLALTTRLGCPAPLRRVLLTGLGVVLASGGAVAVVPVSAAPAPFPPGAGGRAHGASGLPVPARPTGATYALPRQRVVVDPGDSLWRLARQALPRSSTQDLARIVDRTYRANRRVIGPDPDLIHPGQLLRIPQQRRHHPPTSENP
jgi:LysM domain